MPPSWQVRWSVLLLLVLLLLFASSVLFVILDLPWALLLQLVAIALLIASSLLLYRETRREIEQRQVLLKINEDLLSSTDLDDLLGDIVRAARRLVPLAEKCVIHLLDDTGRRLYPRYSSQPEPVRPIGMPAHKGIAGQALQELRTKVVANVQAEPEFLPLQSGAELRSLMVAPLYARGKPLGTISLNSSVPGAFTPRDEMLVTFLAGQASAALYQAQLYAEAVRETRHVEAIINHLADGLLVLDAEGRVLRYNPALAHLLGGEAGQIIGQKIAPESEEESLRRLAALLGEDVRALRQPVERQVVIEEPIHAVLQISLAPVLDADGNWGQIAVFHDQTEALDQVRAQAGLVAATARELRPPLELIQGYATLLLNHDPTDATLTRHAGQIRQQVYRLLRLADDLADLSLDESATPSIRREPVAIERLLAEAVAELAPTVSRQQATVEVQCAPNLPLLALDPERLRHVLLALLENALSRAVPGGHLTLSAEANLEELSVTLADDGRPLSAEEQARLFQSVYRPPEADQQDTGTGLALYLSRRIIQAHGGHLWLAESGAHGTRFQFILPLTEPSAR